jgi:hypothetical protein
MSSKKKERLKVREIAFLAPQVSPYALGLFQQNTSCLVRASLMAGNFVAQAMIP